MSGILAGIKLAEAGLPFTIFEKADRVGGTWRDNTYPGIACDVPSHIYSYSFDLNPDWSHFCSPGSEIQQYFEGAVDRFGIGDHIRLGDAVVSCVWLGDDREWEITTASGVVARFDFAIAATGILHHPKDPDIAGLEDFAGPSFHTARWDHSVDLAGQRVGMIGTGSSGVQIIGAIAGEVERLSVFQRTAQWVVPVEQTAYTDTERDRFRTDADLLRDLHEHMSQSFNDGFATGILDADSGIADDFEAKCREMLAAIEDPELRAKLTPDYRAGCKRLVVSHNFYDAIQRPSVDVVTTSIERIEPTGVRTSDGRLHELDVLVRATGFHVDAFMRPVSIIGRDATSLDDVWEQWPTAYMAVAVPDFPNFFMLNGPNSPVGNFSLIQTAELQFAYIMSLVDQVRDGRLPYAVPTAEAAARFDAERVEAAKTTVWATGCRSWYLDANGVPFAWPFPFERFRREMTEPRLGDYELS